MIPRRCAGPPRRSSRRPKSSWARSAGARPASPPPTPPTSGSAGSSPATGTAPCPHRFRLSADVANLAKQFASEAGPADAGNMIDNYDVVIIGGGAAGLSGAIALARSLRTGLVIDAGDPRNAPSGHVHNFLTQDGTPPAELYEKGRRELAGYGGQVTGARARSISRDNDRFRIDLGTRLVEARRLLIATGARDELPAVPGLAGRWGRDVLHCPYCHGWEVRGQRVGVLSTGPAAVHQALLFRQLTDQVTVLAHRGPELTAGQRSQFADLGITVADGAVVAVESADDHLTGVRLADGAAGGLGAGGGAPGRR